MPEKKKKYLTRDQRDNRTAWIMLAPALLFLAVMIAYPLGKVIHDAFFSGKPDKAQCFRICRSG